ncbi:cytochrome P450 [Aspergillus saccharolyticus JOP 1030-1]|uniref:Putative cytochrome P450 oxidoreductase n=1 Tax=Aspergillus saccharolyticus JOP 1030-1 TaxID=1450539 RepID=A0A318ZHI0_9EURO|nr:putative cytochrome P450 oxidoreductase [Aspergillus saccharolyticus JOP 1030-1]PYH46227.1 putative cytochrome P450 oxidoreductase [Aspergillus saccharolyticus JOP 1030-1]
MVLSLVFLLLRSNKKIKYPPGPRPLPILGNLHQLPRRDTWRTLKSWHDRFGPIITVWMGSRPMVILGSFECAKDLLEKRPFIYSSRPSYLTDGIGSDALVVGLPYGNRWRKHRFLLNTLLSRTRCEDYIKSQDLECKQLLWELLWTNDFAYQFHRFAASLSFSLAYGQRMERGDESEVQEVDRLMRQMSDKVFLPGVAFPLLNYLPQWLAPWKKTAAWLQETQARFFTHQMQKALSQSVKTWSHIVHEVARNRREVSFNELEMAHVVGVTYEAGSDTTAFVLETFVLVAVLQRPAVVRAQIELDKVVGCHRMPALCDLPQLPYLQAFVREVLRWRPVVPGGLHHCTSQDDEYLEYQIPAGTTVIPNHWSLEYDESVFPNPHSFQPERWIDNPKLPTCAFGMGRRACPGRHLAQNSLYLVISRMLWAYDIRCVGRPPDSFAMTQGISSRPRPFAVRFHPRSHRHQSIIETEYRRHSSSRT